MAKQNDNDNVQQQEKQQDLPGYPHYPPAEDIMRTGERVEENLDGETPEGPVNKPASSTPVALLEADADTPVGNFDVTEEDLQALGPVDLSLDLGDDEQLKQRTQPVDFAARDLDVPGSELDDSAESIGAEDEENNPYSLGGDAHSDLEEGRQ